MRDWLVDMAAFTAAVLFITGAVSAVLVIDTRPLTHSAIAAASKRK